MRPIDADALMDVLVAVMDDYRTNGEILKAKATMCAIKCLGNKAVSPTLDLAPKWISVKDRLPEHNVLVLCVWLDGRDRKQNRGFATYQQHGVWYVSNEGMPEVTHWMPLPEPPKEE